MVGARDAGQDREGLHEADKQRLAGAQLVVGALARHVASAPGEYGRGDQESDSRQQRAAEDAVGRFVGKPLFDADADDRSGDRAPNERHDRAAAGGEDARDLAAVIQQHRGEGAKVQGELDFQQVFGLGCRAIENALSARGPSLRSAEPDSLHDGHDDDVEQRHGGRGRWAGRG
jgi:hypothetical protein